MTGQENFAPFIRNQTFPKYVISAAIKQIIQTFIAYPIEKNPIFGSLSQFLGQIKLFQKIQPCHAKLHIGF